MDGGPGELIAKLLANKDGTTTKGSVASGSLVTAAAVMFNLQGKETKRSQAGELGIGRGAIDMYLSTTSLGLDKYVDKFHDLYDKKNKSKLTPAGTSFEELGQGYGRLTMATAEVVGNKEDKVESPQKYLKDIIKIIQDVVGQTEAPRILNYMTVPGLYNQVFNK